MIQIDIKQGDFFYLIISQSNNGGKFFFFNRSKRKVIRILRENFNVDARKGNYIPAQLLKFGRDLNQFRKTPYHFRLIAF